MVDRTGAAGLRGQFEALYARLNRREYVHPDPLEFLYRYDDPLDREVVGLVASALAYGRVAGILNSVSRLLSVLPHPATDVVSSSCRELRRAFRGFRHRFTTGDDMASLLTGAGSVIERYGSLRACFLSSYSGDHDSVLPAMSRLVREVRSVSPSPLDGLMPLPESGSACKRLNLFLRWMVRRDDVDPGGWDDVSPSKLIVPLDIHMHRICRGLGFTRRAAADMRTAIEVTEAFRAVEPRDPVKYDFVLTRSGIRPAVGRGVAGPILNAAVVETAH